MVWISFCEVASAPRVLLKWPQALLAQVRDLLARQKMRDLIGHENISEVRAAVQPGRSICTLKMSTLGTRVAVMTPHVTQASRM